MNALSWLLYLAAIAPSIAGTIKGIGMTLLVGGVIWVIGCSLYNLDENDYSKRAPVVWSMLVSAGVGFTLLVVQALIPPTETFYLIAGSEAGEAVVTSEQGQEIITDIQEVIKHQLEKLKGYDNAEQ